jgi:hypothetical protein
MLFRLAKFMESCRHSFGGVSTAFETPKLITNRVTYKVRSHVCDCGVSDLDRTFADRLLLSHMSRRHILETCVTYPGRVSDHLHSFIRCNREESPDLCLSIWMLEHQSDILSINVQQHKKSEPDA